MSILISEYEKNISFFSFLRASNNCMKTVSSSFDPTALAPYDQNLAGQVYDADAQCVNLYDSNSYMCRVCFNIKSRDSRGPDCI
jgi:hypothetical protein